MLILVRSWAVGEVRLAASSLLARTCVGCHEPGLASDGSSSSWLTRAVGEVRLAASSLLARTCVGCHEPGLASDESSSSWLTRAVCEVWLATSSLLARTCVGCHEPGLASDDSSSSWLTRAVDTEMFKQSWKSTRAGGRKCMVKYARVRLSRGSPRRTCEPDSLSGWIPEDWISSVVEIRVEFTADTLKLNLIELGRAGSKLIMVAGHVDFMCQEVEAADPVTFTTRDSNLVRATSPTQPLPCLAQISAAACSIDIIFQTLPGKTSRRL
uniref:(California timema) hypothetical protein n=1 Tax=Timema californicum TaxID=61474 RepID=A0A7R9J5Q7_TIMCA|nr:unnamed protein product [Timema californicum]